MIAGQLSREEIHELQKFRDYILAQLNGFIFDDVTKFKKYNNKLFSV